MIRQLLINGLLAAPARMAETRGALAQLMTRGTGEISIGSRFRLGGWPAVQVTDGAHISIGDDVEIRANVEIRAHKGARIEIGNTVRIDRGVRLLATNGATLSIRNGARIGIGTVINGGDDVDIGEGALVSGYVYLQTSMHRHAAGASIQSQGFDHAPVVLGTDAWLGTHVVVLPGVTIGAAAVVGSNAVVTKSVPAGQIVAGVPAKPMRER